MRADDAEAGERVLTEGALEVLRAHPWPGNFRELDRAMERALFLYATGQQVTADDVRAAIGGV